MFLGITNYEEYSLIQETIEEKKEEGTGTLKKDRTLLRDERKMEKLKAKLHTDDDCKCLRGKWDTSTWFRHNSLPIICMTQGKVVFLFVWFFLCKYFGLCH